jgi:hypothetical protein
MNFILQRAKSQFITFNRSQFLIKYHDMKTQGTGGIIPRIKITNILNGVTSITPWPLYPLGKEYPVPSV